MTHDTQLTVRESALDVYGDGADIKKLAERIRLCLPGGDKLQDHEALALAQLSVAYQLNPFNGEVWFIPGRGTQVGIKGLRKTAHRQARYWTYFTSLTKEEREANGVPDGAIAYKCELHRTDLILESAAVIRAMKEAGVGNAADHFLYRPTVGIGYFVRGEASKMKADQAARKRAEADALKQAFDLPFASEVGNGSTVGYVDTEWAEVQETHGPRHPVDLYGDRDFQDEPVLVGLTDVQPTALNPAPQLPANPAPVSVPVQITGKDGDGDKPRKVQVAQNVADRWRKGIKALCESEAWYCVPGATEPNWPHILNAVAAVNYAMVTVDNVDLVIDALRSHASEKQRQDEIAAGQQSLFADDAEINGD